MSHSMKEWGAYYYLLRIIDLIYAEIRGYACAAAAVAGLDDAGTAPPDAAKSSALAPAAAAGDALTVSSATASAASVGEAVGAGAAAGADTAAVGDGLRPR